jgi:hypothetical protein
MTATELVTALREHRSAAEQLATDSQYTDADHAMYMIAKAQVHATLAVSLAIQLASILDS